MFTDAHTHTHARTDSSLVVFARGGGASEGTHHGKGTAENFGEKNKQRKHLDQITESSVTGGTTLICLLQGFQPGG